MTQIMKPQQQSKTYQQYNYCTPMLLRHSNTSQAHNSNRTLTKQQPSTSNMFQQDMIGRLTALAMTSKNLVHSSNTLWLPAGMSTYRLHSLSSESTPPPQYLSSMFQPHSSNKQSKPSLLEKSNMFQQYNWCNHWQMTTQSTWSRFQSDMPHTSQANWLPQLSKTFLVHN